MDAISKRFEHAHAAPTSATYSTFALVRKVTPEIRKMNQNGYAWDAIANMMADESVKLSGSALHKEVPDSRDKKWTTKRANGDRREGHAEAAAEPGVLSRPACDIGS